MGCPAVEAMMSLLFSSRSDKEESKKNEKLEKKFYSELPFINISNPLYIRVIYVCMCKYLSVYFFFFEILFFVHLLKSLASLLVLSSTGTHLFGLLLNES